MTRHRTPQGELLRYALHSRQWQVLEGLERVEGGHFSLQHTLVPPWCEVGSLDLTRRSGTPTSKKTVGRHSESSVDTKETITPRFITLLLPPPLSWGQDKLSSRLRSGQRFQQTWDFWWLPNVPGRCRPQLICVYHFPPLGQFDCSDCSRIAFLSRILGTIWLAVCMNMVPVNWMKNHFLNNKRKQETILF